MKLTILFLILSIFNSFGQKNELDFALRYGVPTNNLKIWQPTNFSRYDIYKMRPINDYGVDFLYKFRIWKKYKLYLSAGLSYSKAKYTFPITQRITREMIAGVDLTNNRIVLKLFGIEKKFSFYDDKFKINLGWSVTNNFYFANEKKVKATGLTVDNSEIIDYEHLTYGYDFRLFYNEELTFDNFDKYFNYGLGWRQMYWNGEYYFQFQLAVSEKLGLNFTIDYTRNVVFAYDVKYGVRYKTEDYDYVYGHAGLEGDLLYPVRNHYLGLKIGAFYAF